MNITKRRHGSPSTMPVDEIFSRLESARLQIEQRFLDGGTVMLSVTEVFGRLVQALEKIANSLKEEETRQATDALAVTGKVIARLPAEQAAREVTMLEMNACGRLLADEVVTMEEMLRYLRTFAMTAKITGAGVPDFAGFAAEIIERIQFATQVVGDLSKQVKSLTGMIRITSVADISQLQARQDEIPGVVRDLSVNAKSIETQRQTLVSIAMKVAELARKVQGRMANTLSALQVGDSTRQRIEHCQTALTTMTDYLDSEAANDLPAHGRKTISLKVMQLVFEQLRHISTEFDRDCGKIVTNIRDFSHDVTALMQLYDTMLPHGDNGQATAIRSVEKNLLAARSSVRIIEDAAQEAMNLSEGTRALTEDLAQNVSTIQLVRTDIQYMALNTNLRCSKLGEEGRAINVVTTELRSFSAKLDEAAGRVLDNMKLLTANAASLSGAAQGANNEPASGPSELIEIALQHITSAGDAMEDQMKELVDCGKDVSIKVTQAITRLDFHSGLGENLADCANRAADALDEEPHTEGVEDALAEISSKIARVYTMKSERDIHAGIFGAVYEAPQETKPQAVDEEDLFEDALF